MLPVKRLAGGRKTLALLAAGREALPLLSTGREALTWLDASGETLARLPRLARLPHLARGGEALPALPARLTSLACLALPGAGLPHLPAHGHGLAALAPHATGRARLSSLARLARLARLSGLSRAARLPAHGHGLTAGLAWNAHLGIDVKWADLLLRLDFFGARPNLHDLVAVLVATQAHVVHRAHADIPAGSVVRFVVRSAAWRQGGRRAVGIRAGAAVSQGGQGGKAWAQGQHGQQQDGRASRVRPLA